MDIICTALSPPPPSRLGFLLSYQVVVLRVKGFNSMMVPMIVMMVLRQANVFFQKWAVKAIFIQKKSLFDKWTKPQKARREGFKPPLIYGQCPGCPQKNGTFLKELSQSLDCVVGPEYSFGVFSTSHFAPVAISSVEFVVRMKRCKQTNRQTHPIKNWW